jgi:type II secretory pathway pseudopilin PulG
MLEIMLVMAIISILGAFSVPIYFSFQAKNDLDLATDVVVQVVRRAETLSRTMSYDDGWGVYITQDGITLFKGDDFTGRDGAYDEVSVLAGSVVVENDPVEITFEKLTGYPVDAPITVQLGSTSLEDTSIITINERGAISF